MKEAGSKHVDLVVFAIEQKNKVVADELLAAHMTLIRVCLSRLLA